MPSIKTILGISFFIFLAFLSNAFAGDDIKTTIPRKINGLDLRIPKNYVLSGVLYKDGEEHQNIKRFDILVRISNFKPISSKKDLDDWVKAGLVARPSFETTWLMVNFNNSYLLPTPYKSQMPERLLQDAGGLGPYKKMQDFMGLKHYSSVKSPDETSIGHRDFYYNKSLTTTIICDVAHSRRSV